jgi:carboxypeptidase PM20D1
MLSASPPLNAILRTTMTPTMLTGSPADNVLAVEAKAAINIRIHPRDTVDSVLQHVKSLFADDPDVSVSIASGRSSAHNPSAISSTDADSYRLLERTTREVFPEAVVAPYLVIAATDSRHYSSIAENTYRFGPFVLGPDDLELPHGTNERIKPEVLANLVRFYARLLTNMN